MPQAYAIYLVGDDGHFKQRVDVVCNDDEEAKSKAEQMLDGRPVEVWQEARRVVTLLPAK